MSSKKVEFKGACAATATPFTANDEVNIEEYKRHVEFMITSGLNGLFPVGFVSGGLTLSPEEWRTVVKATVEQAKGRVPVFPMCYVPGTKNAIRQIKEMQDLGADGAYLPTPPVWRAGSPAVYQHYRMLAEETEVPLILYNAWITTGTVLPFDVVERLVDEFPGKIIGYKEHDLTSLPVVIAKLGDRISIAPSCLDIYILPGLALGVHAKMSMMAMVVPKRYVEMFNAYKSGNIARAKEIYYELLPLFALMTKIIGDHQASTLSLLLNHMGFDFGKARSPFLWPVEPELQQEVDQIARQINLAAA